MAGGFHCTENNLIVAVQHDEKNFQHVKQILIFFSVLASNCRDVNDDLTRNVFCAFISIV